MIKQDGVWKRAPLTNYQDEVELRDLIAASPDLVPGCAGNVTMVELSVPGAGRADVVLVDESGAITIVEAKLANNSQVRREVVGQIFAYASGLKGLGFEQFAQYAGQRLGMPLLSALQESSGQPVEPDELRRRISSTLEEGSFRLVVAVDEITDELKRIVEYLNDHLSDEVSMMALELGVLKIEGTEVLVPATYGAELPQPSAGPAKRAWTYDEIAEAKEAVAPGPARELLERLWQHAEHAGATIKGGTGVSSPSAGVYYHLGPDTRSLWSVWLPEDDGPKVSLNLGSLRSTSESVAREVVQRLRVCSELTALLGLPDNDDEAIGKYPSVQLDALDPDGCGAGTMFEAVELAASATTLPEA